MKHVKTIIIFLLIFFVGQWFITIALDTAVSKSSFRFSKLYSKSAKMNNTILCIGNSRGVNSFYSPHIDKKFSVKSFNLSYNGMNIKMVRLFLEDYLLYHHPPKTIFIEISNLFNADSIPDYSAFNLYSNKSKRLTKNIKSTDFRTYLISTLFPIYRFNSELFYRSLYYLNKSDQNWINRYQISSELEAEILTLRPFNLEFDDADLVLLRHTMESLERKGIKVILFIAPYHPNYLLKIKNMNDVVTRIEKETAVPVLNISGLITKSEYFADRIHTNEKGAISIGDKLMDYLNSSDE